MVNSITETVENLGPDFGNGLAIQHTVLGTILPSGEKYVVDPTSLQFGIRGKYNKLMYSGSWNEYCEIFPGRHITVMRYGWKESKDEVQMLYEIGNQGFRHIDQLVEKALRNVDEDSCNHCGQTERQGDGITLMTCSRCKETRYCDKLCQKSNWKFHKSFGCKVEQGS